MVQLHQQKLLQECSPISKSTCSMMGWKAFSIFEVALLVYPYNVKKTLKLHCHVWLLLYIDFEISMDWQGILPQTQSVFLTLQTSWFLQSVSTSIIGQMSECPHCTLLLLRSEIFCVVFQRQSAANRLCWIEALPGGSREQQQVVVN